jgi:hypothetical protein
MKLNEKMKNYFKLFAAGLILLWLFLQSPFNPLYSDYTQGEMDLIKIHFFYWIIVSAFAFLIIFYLDYLILFVKMNNILHGLEVDSVLIFFLSFTLFFVLLTFAGSVNYCVTDNEIHSFIILKINYNLTPYPPNFLFYLVTNMISFFSKNIVAIYLASSFVLALSIAVKYKISKIIIQDRLQLMTFFIKGKDITFLLIIVTTGLILFFPIQDYFGMFVIGRFYIGKITPNVWHNSTIIFLAPFSLLLFYYQYKELINDKATSRKAIIILSVLVLLNIFAKPSFFLVYAPVSSIFLLLKHRISLKFLKSMIPIIIGIIALYFMYKLIFVYKIGGQAGHESGSVVFSKPFEAWLFYIPNWYLTIAIVHSFALPIFYIVFYKESLKNKLFQYASTLTIFGLLVSAFVIEDGLTKIDFNFMWQNVVCYYILILVITSDLLLKYLKEGLKSYKMKILTIIFFLHAVSGIGYIIKLLITRNIS